MCIPNPGQIRWRTPRATTTTNRNAAPLSVSVEAGAFVYVCVLSPLQDAAVTVSGSDVATSKTMQTHTYVCTLVGTNYDMCSTVHAPEMSQATHPPHPYVIFRRCHL